MIFERFLNPDRISMPDFDIDFCEEKRDLVFKYLTTKYKDSVAHIITFGKLKARMVIRDVGRVLGLPYGFVDSISKMIPFDPSRPLSLIECINKKFDPNFHQGMLEIEDNTKESSTVVQEIQKGYMMKDRLLRPSLVGVTKKREQKDKETKTNETKSEKNDEKK